MTDDLEQDVSTLWSLLFDIVTDSEKRLAAHMAAHQLTPPQFYVLKTLAEHDGHCQIGQIAREHHLTNATMTGIIKRMEAMQPPLVKRMRSPTDGRSVDVFLTDAGSEQFIAVQESLMDQLRLLFSLLSPEDRRDTIEKIQFYFKLMVEHFPAIGS